MYFPIKFNDNAGPMFTYKMAITWRMLTDSVSAQFSVFTTNNNVINHKKAI